MMGMPCPYCQEPIEWGLSRCPHCGHELDISYLSKNKPKTPKAAKRKLVPRLPNSDKVNWVGMAGVVMAAIGICTLIFTLFSRMHFPAIERAWPSFLLLFGLWALYVRRKSLTLGAFIPLATGFLFRGLQLSLNGEEWSEIGSAWPVVLFVLGVIWTLVASPDWRKENLTGFWPWPRKK
jgi:hypothetical protein